MVGCIELCFKWIYCCEVLRSFEIVFDMDVATLLVDAFLDLDSFVVTRMITCIVIFWIYHFP